MSATVKTVLTEKQQAVLFVDFEEVDGLIQTLCRLKCKNQTISFWTDKKTQGLTVHGQVFCQPVKNLSDR